MTRKSPVDSTQSETFGCLVKRIRATTQKETQQEWAARFHIHRTVLSEIENDKKDGIDLLAGQLREAWPELAADIDAATHATRAIRSRLKEQSRKKASALEVQVSSFLEAGQFAHARRLLLEGLDKTDDDRDCYWMYELLATALFGQGNKPGAYQALADALQCTVRAGLTDLEISTRDRLAYRRQMNGDFEIARQVVDVGLQQYPESAALWLRKGKVHWYECTFDLAYSSLTTALAHGAKRESTLHARGQALAEWHSFDAALADIEEYLSIPGTREASRAWVRSARAYVWGHTGHIAEAIAEFEQVEKVTGGTPWTSYRRGLAHAAAGETDNAIQHLTAAVKDTSPALKEPLRTRAIQALRDYGINPD